MAVQICGQDLPVVRRAGTGRAEAQLTVARALARWAHGHRPALLDDYPGFGSFTDTAVRRPEARQLLERVRVERLPVETGTLLDGRVALRVGLAGGGEARTQLALPPGAPERPLSGEEVRAKAAACEPDVPGLLEGLTWAGAREVVRTSFPYADQEA
ncbi:hypothetical protein ACYF6T_01440 [Streptomyces sp. 7R007]